VNHLLTTIYSSGENYAANVFWDDNNVVAGKFAYWFYGDMDNCVDGTPYWEEDPCGASGTALYYKGKPVNGDIVPGIVLPPDIIKAVKDVVLGCQSLAIRGTHTISTVVYDVGPTKKVGEGSPATLRALGAPAPQDGMGGIDEQEVLYMFWPGVPAILLVDGSVYKFDLKPYGGS
jgi:hypothetical protein